MCAISSLKSSRSLSHLLMSSCLHYYGGGLVVYIGWLVYRLTLCMGRAVFIRLIGRWNAECVNNAVIVCSGIIASTMCLDGGRHFMAAAT